MANGKHSPKAWNIRMLLPLFPAFSGWLALTLHGFANIYGNRVPNQAGDRAGPDRSRFVQRRARIGLDVRRVIRSRREVPPWLTVASASVCWRDTRRLSWLGATAQGAAKCPEKLAKTRPPKKCPRLGRRRPSSEVRNLLTYSPVFREQSWQRYRIKDTDKGPEVWEVKWAVF